MSRIDLNSLLHQRIINKCMSLFENKHFPQAALEAIKQVELALKEKTEVREELFGARLIEQVFGPGKTIKLKVPLGEELQEQAKKLFKGTFSYYRNYAAHDGSRIGKTICIRIMVLASELLDLIGASSISFTEIGGVKGLIEHRIFKNKTQLFNLLSFLSSQVFPHEAFNGIFENLAERGFIERQYKAVFDLGLIEYHSEIRNHNFPNEPPDWDTIGWLELTPGGQKVLSQLRKSSS